MKIIVGDEGMVPVLRVSPWRAPWPTTLDPNQLAKHW